MAPPCRFYNTPGGCRRGTQCTFAHTSLTPSRANIATADKNTVASTTTGAITTSSVPRGSCPFYWRSGECTKGFKCRYKHEQDPATVENPQSGVIIPAILTPFLTTAALSRLNAPGTDALFAPNTKARSPSEVHNLLKRFLYDDYHFRHALDVYAFTSLLSDATSNNETWSVEDGQLLLTAIATDNGILRINDILNWEKVSATAGGDRTTLSFQRAYVPILQYFSSDFVVKSILSHLVNALYMLLMEHFDRFAERVKSCMDHAVHVAKTFTEPRITSRIIGGSQVFGSLFVVLYQCLIRIKNATAKYPGVRELVHSLQQWLASWIAGLSTAPPSFTDSLTSAPYEVRQQLCNHLMNKVEQIVAIVDREHAKIQRPKKPIVNTFGMSEEGTLAALHNSYLGPGHLRPEGPRHDNDFVDISDIRIAPTHEELVSRIPPFLPANIYGAPHPLPLESPERLLDTQFRLLREELTAPLRSSVQQVFDDLESTQTKTQLNELIRRGGGKYRGQSDQQDSLLFNLYTNVEFLGISPDRRGISVSMSLDTPPGRARAAEANRRAAFWESNSGKRLLSGGLVALIWQRTSGTEVHLGLISSSVRDHVTSARLNADKINIRVGFFDPGVELRILQELRYPIDEREGVKLLIEATVMFASVRPFLDALRVEPTTVPFTKYLVHHPPGIMNTMKVDPPTYARLPGFKFELGSLFDAAAGVEGLSLSVTDEESIQAARETLRELSRLDPSQADAVINAVTHEVALIQGPPGTGKSYTGVELLRVLVKNGAGPILMIAFTNHALDHLLCSVLDAGITQKIVRLGSRSSDERISKFSIETMEEVAGRSRLDRAFAKHYRELKLVQDELKELMKECLRTSVDTSSILSHLEVNFPVHFQSFQDMPPWVSILYQTERENANNGELWTRVGKGGHDEESDDTAYGYWLSGSDLDFLESAHAQAQRSADAYDADVAEESNGQARNATLPSNPFELLRDSHEDDEEALTDDLSVDVADLELDDVSPEEAWMFLTEEINSDSESPQTTTDKHDLPQSTNPVVQSQPVSNPPEEHGTIRATDFHDIRDFFDFFGYVQMPLIPQTDRHLNDMMDIDDVWILSRSERARLHSFWTDEVRLASQETRVMEFERLRKKHEDAMQKYNEGKAEARCTLLRNVDIIGCTTTGAANLTTLLQAIGPKIMLVEEAGQVLEAHVLGSLVPSVEHLILIGDPLQLRPTLNNYAMSVEHKQGGLLYKFDMSLMERLSTSGFPMSQIDVQRRMRPEISELVRLPLYPALQDHDLVKDYPPVQGIAKNVFFLTHKHKENGGEDDSVSKFNAYEVDMIVDLVMYLLRQGPYGGEGDIVVLCAYLGQLARMRDALGDKVAVVIDERDQRELNDREAEQDETVVTQTSVVEHVKVSRRVRLRTIDNYQGEESKIVILSLVRNSGGSEDDEGVYGHSTKGRVNVGFLKSENRTNVALSRAREGLFILGNAEDLKSRSKMWRTVIAHLEKEDCVGEAFPIVCHRHKDVVQYVSKPKQLPRISPDGGCLQQCDARLLCGHLCPFKCHSDDPKHLSVVCSQRCTRLCSRGHPCSRRCADVCGKCRTLVPNIALPCGHIKAEVDCAFLDDLSEVPCDVLVRKKLPNCEHEAEMRCSDDPSKYRCKAPCGGILECCGRTCKAQCHMCQSQDAPEGGELPAKVHQSHPCQKPLYCEHLCNKPCSRDHECATLCEAQCQIVCTHARCKERCSKPCAPCQEPCTWQCPHQSCMLPCGSICARLPCDVRCSKLLGCGHRCPSVCGEDCSIQVCPTCASNRLKDTIVDLILHLTLGDIDPDSEGLDNLLITIPQCGHVFTVETLDGVLSMGEYYDQDANGNWTGLRMPDTGFAKPPTCPTCRAAIKCPRYGRIFKRADLDIQERNVASHMSRSLSDILSRVNGSSKEGMKTRLQTDAVSPALTVTKSAAGDKELQACRKRQAAFFREPRSTPAAVASLDPADSLHGLPLPEAKAWRRVLRDLLTYYRDTSNVASIRSSHTHAWEASFAYLYEQEMDAASKDPARAPRNPHEHAMRMARIRVGQPQPRADLRYLVEAFWMSINIRLTIVELTKAWFEALASREDYPKETRRAWERYIFFVLRTCVQDAKIALTIAQKSESRRQTAETALLLTRIELEKFTFNMSTLQNKNKFSDRRLELADHALAQMTATQQHIAAVTSQYRGISRSLNAEALQWFEINFVQPSSSIVEEWQKLERSLRMATFYQPIDMKEIQEIVSVLRSSEGFSHTGHFFKCPNGHTYVIGECGGAMETSICNECGAAIGGNNHTRLANNQRDAVLEEALRQQGAQNSPWAWGA